MEALKLLDLWAEHLEVKIDRSKKVHTDKRLKRRNGDWRKVHWYMWDNRPYDQQEERQRRGINRGLGGYKYRQHPGLPKTAPRPDQPYGWIRKEAGGKKLPVSWTRVIDMEYVLFPVEELRVRLLTARGIVTCSVPYSMILSIDSMRKRLLENGVLGGELFVVKLVPIIKMVERFIAAKYAAGPVVNWRYDRTKYRPVTVGSITHLSLIPYWWEGTL